MYPIVSKQNKLCGSTKVLLERELLTMGGQRTVFRNLAKLVLIRDLARPLGPVLQQQDGSQAALNTLERNAQKLQYDPMERLSLVTNDHGVVGSVSFFDVATSEVATIGELAKTVPPSDIVSADLDALAAVPLLTVRGDLPFFVLDGNTMIGTVQYSDIFGSAFRLCLFALTLELEECALRCLLSRATDAAAVLSDGRLEKARGVCELKYGSRGIERTSNLIRSTTFIDKATMLTKLKLVPGMSNTKLQDLFVRAEELRNYCAHPSIDSVRTAPIVKRDELQTFLDRWRQVVELLEHSCHQPVESN